MYSFYRVPFGDSKVIVGVARQMISPAQGETELKGVKEVSERER